mgnify:CR=1 FL=1
MVDQKKIKNKLYSLKNLAATSASDILGTALSAAFWLYIATQLDVEKFGEIQYFIGIASLGSAFALIGTQTVITVYTAKNVKLQSTLSFMSFIAGFVSSLVIILIFFRIDASLAVIAYIINSISLGYLLGRKEFVSYFKFAIIQRVLLLVLGIGFYFIFGGDGIIFAIALSFVSYSFIIYKIFKETKINFKLLKPHFSFITNNYAMYATNIFGSQIDKLLVAPILGFVVLGNYALAIQLISILAFVPAILFKYLLPHDSTNVENHKIKKYAVLFSIGIFFLMVFLAPLVIPYFFPKYENVIEITQIMSITIVIGTITSIYSSKFFGKEISRYNFIATICGASTSIIGVLILGQLYGIYGVAIAFVLSSVSICLCLAICDKIYYKKRQLD